MILIIESSADFPSVAVCNEMGELCYEEIVNVPQSHSEKLPVLVQNALNSIESSGSKLSAIAVNSGPGSYTGLRIGVSLAKGICYAKNIPLISVDGLEAMGKFVLENHSDLNVVYSMIDARRDEVFMRKVYRNTPSSNIEATILIENHFDENWNETAFVGNSNDKAIRILNVHPSLTVDGPIANQMVDLVCASYREKKFENVAYFEPYYLKDFVPGISKKFAV